MKLKAVVAAVMTGAILAGTVAGPLLHLQQITQISIP